MLPDRGPVSLRVRVGVLGRTPAVAGTAARHSCLQRNQCQGWVEGSGFKSLNTPKHNRRPFRPPVGHSWTGQPSSCRHCLRPPQTAAAASRCQPPAAPAMKDRQTSCPVASLVWTFAAAAAVGGGGAAPARTGTTPGCRPPVLRLRPASPPPAGQRPAPAAAAAVLSALARRRARLPCPEGSAGRRWAACGSGGVLGGRPSGRWRPQRSRGGGWALRSRS